MNTDIISFGSRITDNATPLSKVTIEYLYNSLLHPKPAIQSQIRQLRIMYNVDKKGYNNAKRQLPYIVCGIFNPPYRKTENFAYTDYFILDIDHIGEKGYKMGALREQFKKDTRTMLMYASPSMDGLKILFKLRERCHDSGMYRMFYKVFAQKFSSTYQLDQVVDAVTCDVARACFVSIGPDVYYNPCAEPVDMKEYIDTLDPLAATEIQREMKALEAEGGAKPAGIAHQKEPDADVISHIRETLGLKTPKNAKPQAYVPEQLNDIMGQLSEYITRAGVEITEIINISYAKKIRMKMGLSQAEINLFFGKKGYNPVISPRTGTSSTLNELCRDLIISFLAENEMI